MSTISKQGPTLGNHMQILKVHNVWVHIFNVLYHGQSSSLKPARINFDDCTSLFNLIHNLQSKGRLVCISVLRIKALIDSFIINSTVNCRQSVANYITSYIIVIGFEEIKGISFVIEDLLKVVIDPVHKQNLLFY